MKINKNIIWTQIFFDGIADLGIKYVCLAPGSRSTPLTFAVAANKKLKSYVFIDERSCAFFALGLAKSSKSPVVLICTSGTAAAEFYPAIIEAFQQKTPLIVCTADRPPELIDNGANQTIIQNSIYKNHVLWSLDVGLPELTSAGLKHIKAISKRAFYECYEKNYGPVHLNFPFRKPFEPDSFTDDIDEEIINSTITKKLIHNNFVNNKLPNVFNPVFQDIISEIKECKKGIIIAGPDDNDNYTEACIKLAQELNFPIFADGASQFRFGKLNCKHVLNNYDAYLRSDFFLKEMQPEIILQFGRTVTSIGLETFLESTGAKRFIINEFGNWYDPYNNAETVLAVKPEQFCKYISRELEGNYKPVNSWFDSFINAEQITRELKNDIIYKAAFPFEGRIINEVISLMPNNSALMVSNSMPVRDLEYFAPKTGNKIFLFTNRGVSGIDGITSTALGISAAHGNPTVLITGDLAFFHDLNGLFCSYKYSIPLIAILINNNGGGIFDMLPVSKYENVFNDFFLTPHNLDFTGFVNGYGGDFVDIKSWDNLKTSFQSAIESKRLTVLQLNTNSKESANIRKDFWEKVKDVIKSQFDN